MRKHCLHLPLCHIYNFHILYVYRCKCKHTFFVMYIKNGESIMQQLQHYMNSIFDLPKTLIMLEFHLNLLRSA